MEQINNLLQTELNHVTGEPTNYLNEVKKNLSLLPAESKIIELKYASKNFGLMSPDELSIAVKKMLLKISVITGWILPEREFMDILLEEFTLKILEDYFGVNLDEVAHAFRCNSGVKDWGKNLNINLFDEVMIPYINKRFELSKVEESVKTVPEQKIYTDDQILNQRREEIELAFQAMKRGRMPIIHVYFHKVLQVDGLITEETIEEFLTKALATKEKLYDHP